jgi:hypothetical protein
VRRPGVVVLVVVLPAALVAVVIYVGPDRLRSLVGAERPPSAPPGARTDAGGGPPAPATPPSPDEELPITHGDHGPIVSPSDASPDRPAFRPPAPGTRLVLHMANGTASRGILDTLDEHTVVLRRGPAKVTLTRTQLAPASRAALFAADHAALRSRPEPREPMRPRPPPRRGTEGGSTAKDGRDIADVFFEAFE